MRVDNDKILKREKIKFEIAQRAKIIRDYEIQGSLDRNNIIDMIVSLRRTDPVVLVATGIDNMPSNESAPLSISTDEHLIDELTQTSQYKIPRSTLKIQ